MKKSLIIGLLGTACCATASFGQGEIALDNYNTGGPLVTYGSSDIPANGVSGPAGAVGTGLQAGWTLGFYYALGDVTGAIGSEYGGNWAEPSVLGGGLVLATGIGSSAPFSTSTGEAGEVFSSYNFAVPGTSPAGGDTITLMMIAYAGPSYASAMYRGHSAAFTMTTLSNTSLPPHAIGSFMPAFSIIPIPEPSTFALAGLSAFALLRLRFRA